MNWSSAKTILIWFLIIANIILATILIRANILSNQIPLDTLNNAISLLNEHNITLDSSIIPKKQKSCKIYTVENSIADYTDFAKKVLGDNFVNNENQFYSESATLTFSGDSFEIFYKDGYDANEKLKTPSDKAKDYLLTLGIDVKRAEVSIINDARSIFTVDLTAKLKGTPFFDRKIELVFSGNKIISVKGSWFTKTDAPASQLNLNFLPGLMVKYAASNKDFSNLEINNITLGYTIGENNVFHKTATVIPVYKLTTTDGREFMIDIA